MKVSEKARRSAGAYEATLQISTQTPQQAQPVKKTYQGYMRGRILPSPPYAEDFESFELTNKRKDGTPFAHPPLPWIGARLKWQVRQRDGNNILAKTLDRWLFQRSMVFIGHPDDGNYTLTADVMSDGNRRGTSDVGLINQRYIIVLRGNAQRLEVNSNIDRLYEKAAIVWEPKTWYRLKTRVDVGEDGAGIVRAKVWPRENDEPQPWTIEVPVKRAHRNGSPGLFGFSPNVKFAVYVDNLAVTPND